jgi:hypothetical protein
MLVGVKGTFKLHYIVSLVMTEFLFNDVELMALSLRASV